MRSNNGQKSWKRSLMNEHVLKLNPMLLKEFNVVSVAELFDGIKFQCSNCGQRFVRNETLKAHLDKHFAENNEIRKRKRVGQLMYPSYVVGQAVGGSIPSNSVGTQPVSAGNSLAATVGVMSENRPLFQGLSSWINQGVGTTGCISESTTRHKNEVQKTEVSQNRKLYLFNSLVMKNIV